MRLPAAVEIVLFSEINFKINGMCLTFIPSPLLSSEIDFSPPRKSKRWKIGVRSFGNESRVLILRESRISALRLERWSAIDFSNELLDSTKLFDATSAIVL